MDVSDPSNSAQLNRISDVPSKESAVSDVTAKGAFASGGVGEVNGAGARGVIGVGNGGFVGQGVF